MKKFIFTVLAVGFVASSAVAAGVKAAKADVYRQYDCSAFVIGTDKKRDVISRTKWARSQESAKDNFVADLVNITEIIEVRCDRTPEPGPTR